MQLWTPAPSLLTYSSSPPAKDKTGLVQFMAVIGLVRLGYFGVRLNCTVNFDLPLRFSSTMETSHVCNYVISRGIDIPHDQHVISCDIHQSQDDYTVLGLTASFILKKIKSLNTIFTVPLWLHDILGRRVFKEFTDRIASSYQDCFEILDWKSPDILWQVVEQPHSQQWEAVIRPVYSSEGYF